MYKVMSKTNVTPWHVEYFQTEEKARAYANDCYRNGDNRIELYQKARTGYQLVKRFQCSQKQANRAWADHVAECAPKFC